MKVVKGSVASIWLARATEAAGYTPARCADASMHVLPCSAGLCMDARTSPRRWIRSDTNRHQAVPARATRLESALGVLGSCPSSCHWAGRQPAGVTGAAPTCRARMHPSSSASSWMFEGTGRGPQLCSHHLMRQATSCSQARARIQLLQCCAQITAEKHRSIRKQLAQARHLELRSSAAGHLAGPNHVCTISKMRPMDIRSSSTHWPGRQRQWGHAILQTMQARTTPLSHCYSKQAVGSAAAAGHGSSRNCSTPESHRLDPQMHFCGSVKPEMRQMPCVLMHLAP